MIQEAIPGGVSEIRWFRFALSSDEIAHMWDCDKNVPIEEQLAAHELVLSLSNRNRLFDAFVSAVFAWISVIYERRFP